ncbi:MAG: IS4 family transposase [Chloroflexia bacterium]|nr:IS4 family transposase [Chloroflexia bacterium]
MGYRLREPVRESKFSSELRVEALSRVVGEDVVRVVLESEGVREERERKLTMRVVVYLVIAMNIFTHVSMGHVMRKLSQGLRFIWHDPEYRLPTEPALTYRRYQLGARPLAALFHQVCKPLATPATNGAYLFGLRLMAIDGTTEDVPDTPENLVAFGKHNGGRGDSAFPQVQAVSLAECGTHAIVDAGFWPCHTSEEVGARRLLRSVGTGMLVMIDRSLYSYDFAVGIRGRGAHVLARMPAHVKPKPVRTLPDGTYLAWIYPAQRKRRKSERTLVRIVEYTLTDPSLPGCGQRYRLVTSLLSHTEYPALELACGYHERWEIEITIDETDTHQRLAGRTLRSLKPVGVIQELYGLLIAHYAIRAVMHEAALAADIDPDRLSFVHAVRVTADAIAEFQMIAPEQLPQLYARLLRDIAAKRLPERRVRSNPRVVKRKMSNFRLKRRGGEPPPQPAAASWRDAVALSGQHTTPNVSTDAPAKTQLCLI